MLVSSVLAVVLLMLELMVISYFLEKEFDDDDDDNCVCSLGNFWIIRIPQTTMSSRYHAQGKDTS